MLAALKAESIGSYASVYNIVGFIHHFALYYRLSSVEIALFAILKLLLYQRKLYQSELWSTTKKSYYWVKSN